MGLSQEQLAEKLYVSRQTISNWERDKTYPDVQSLLMLSILFDTSIDTLVKGDVTVMEEAVERDRKRMGTRMLWLAVLMLALLAVAFALLFSFVRSRSSQSADTIIGVFSSTAVALGIFIATMGGGSFTKFNKYLIGDILSVTPGEVGRLALVLLGVALLWIFAANRLFLTAVHPQLASSRGIPTEKTQALFTVCIAVVVTLAMSWVGLMVINSLLVLPAASSRNITRNLREYHLLSVLGALVCSVGGLVTAYYLGCSAGATIALYLALYFTVTFFFRNTRQ